MKQANEIEIREFIDEAEAELLFPLISQQNPEIDKNTFQTRLGAMLKEGFRCIGAFDDKKLVGCAGFWTGTRFWCGTFIEPDNVVMLHNYRHQGIGRKLMQWIEYEAKRLNCEIIKIETYAKNMPARSFYAKQSYEEIGIVLVKPLQMSGVEWNKKLNSKSQ